MKHFFSFAGSLLLSMVLAAPALAQNVGIGTSTPAASAALDVTAPANNKGLLPPRLTELQRNAIVSPASGLLIYNTDSKHLNVWDGTSWTSPISNNETAYVPGSQSFGYTGGPQTYVVPRGVTSVVVDAYGASGMAATQAPFGPGGNGARVQATLAVTPGQVLTVYVGGTAHTNPVDWTTPGSQPYPPTNGGGGYNGGGDGGLTGTGGGQITPTLWRYYYEYRGGGGGATDIRSGGTALTDRILVAAGGGGTSGNATGGNGGLNGAAGTANAGQGGTQTAGGAGATQGAAGTLGQGGRGYGGTPTAGGGGGYYGGGGSGGPGGGGGGGGGSSYTAPTIATSVTVTAGARVGDGLLTISPVPAVQYAAPVISGSNVALPSSADGGVVFSGTPGLKTNSSQFFWDNSTNRLGIGTTTPQFSVHSVSGFYSSGTGGEFTFADRADNSKRFSWYATNDRATLWHSQGGDRLTVAAGGNVGIGTISPGARLDVVGGGGYSIDLTVNGRLRSGDGTNGGGMYVNGAQNQFVGQYDGSRMGLYNNTWGLVMNNAGRVGIGTVNPLVPLDVQGGASIGTYYFAFYNVNGPDGSGFSNSNQPDVTIRASGRVVGAEFNATSDRRLKNIIGQSDNAADLSLLQKIRITDYTMRDRAIYGQRQFKKVIAQEVEAVFPQAVHQQTGFLPDVYALAAGVRSEGDSLTVISLPTGLATAATAGQRLKLVLPTGSVVGTVGRPAAVGARQLLVRGLPAIANNSQVFVFGLEHADVRTVDYEALAMLNVSATQELARQLAAAQAQLRQQAACAAQAEAALGGFEQRLRALEAQGEQARR